MPRRSLLGCDRPPCDGNSALVVETALRRSLLDLLVPAGLTSFDEVKRWRFSVLVGFIASLVTASFALLYALLGAPLGAVILACNSILIIFFVWCSKRTGQLDRFFMAGAVVVMTTMAYLSITTGRFGLAFVMWFFLIPAASLLSLGLEKMWSIAAVGFTLGTVSFVLPYLGLDLGTLPVSDAVWNVLNYGSWLVFMVVGTVMAFMLHELNARTEGERQRLHIVTENSRRLEAVGELAGGVAHEFNNLLTVIRGTASVIREESASEGVIADGLVDIERAATRGGEIARELLLFARGRQESSTGVTDTRESLLASMRMIRPILGLGIEIVSSVPPSLPHVAVSTRTLEQSMVNIALNARDAMKTASGTLTIEAASVSLSAEEARPLEIAGGSWVRIVVTDDGAGMDRDTLARIYEPFFTTKEEGTGLGMAVIFGLLRQAGGAVTVKSAAGVGTTVTLYLPVANSADLVKTEQAGSHVALAPKNSTALSSGVILLVEDQKAVRRMARRILVKEGYEVVEAEDGVEALQMMVAGQNCQLIVSDVRMPRMGGAQLARELLEQDRKVPIIFMTGFAGSEDEERALDTLGEAVLRKPFAPDELLRACALSLERSRQD